MVRTKASDDQVTGNNGHAREQITSQQLIKPTSLSFLLMSTSIGKNDRVRCANFYVASRSWSCKSSLPIFVMLAVNTVG